MRCVSEDKLFSLLALEFVLETFGSSWIFAYRSWVMVNHLEELRGFTIEKENKKHGNHEVGK